MPVSYVVWGMGFLWLCLQLCKLVVDFYCD